jgi:hypothetical protein
MRASIMQALQIVYLAIQVMHQQITFLVSVPIVTIQQVDGRIHILITAD